MKKFKEDFDGGQLGESTIRLLKKYYVEELKKAKHNGATVPRKRRRPLTFGDVDTKMQTALRKARTHVNANIVLAAE